MIRIDLIDQMKQKTTICQFVVTLVELRLVNLIISLYLTVKLEFEHLKVISINYLYRRCFICLQISKVPNGIR